jgi:hypothetical protein
MIFTLFDGKRIAFFPDYTIQEITHNGQDCTSIRRVGEDHAHVVKETFADIAALLSCLK